MTLDAALITALHEIASHEGTLLVASDFDGVIAPLVSDPAAVVGLPGSLSALNELSKLTDTEVALVSGRSLAFLSSVEGRPADAWLAGSHGSELGHRPPTELDESKKHLLESVTNDLRSLATSAPGSIVEEKSASVAFHYRNVDPSLTAELRSTVFDGPGSIPGIETKLGKMVIELTVFTAHKGTAVEALRTDSGADRVVYLGDDVTDEDAFKVLGAGDVGVKVGDGPTAAAFRVDDPEAVTLVLETLLDARRRR